MNYYLYVSDAKLEMLYAQVPTRVRDKIATELKIDLKIISATFKEKMPQEVRYQQLNLVRKYLDDNVEVGSVLHPAAWIKAVMAMRWASIMGGEDGDVVYFGAEQDGVVLGLVGSRRHLVGMRGEGIVDLYGGSGFAPSVLLSLERHLGRIMAQDETRDTSVLERTRDGQAANPNEDSLSTVALTTSSLVGPLQRLEFLAKRLLQGTVTDTHTGLRKTVILASPLFVALVE